MALWSFEQLFFSPRTLVMLAVVSVPVLLAALYQTLLRFGFEMTIAGSAFFSVITATLGFQFVSPMLALFYASGVVSDDVESGTINYFSTRPRRRSELMAGKMLGSLLCQLTLFLPALVLSFYVCLAHTGWAEVGGRFPTLARDIGAAVAGAVAYNGLFALLGAALRRPLLIGLFFVFGWQAAATYVPGVVRQLTVAHYLQSLLPHESFQGAMASVLGSRSSPLVSVGALLGISIASHGLAMWWIERKEIVEKV